MKNSIEYIKLLGSLAKDRITDYEGVITSVSFDLYGCIQVVLAQRKIDEKGENCVRWFDINRLDIRNKKVMECPFETIDIPKNHQDFTHGPSEKPKPS